MQWNPFTKKATPPTTTAKKTEEIGFSGLPYMGGRVYEELLKDLQGERGRRLYREMADNDDAIGAILSAVEMMLRGVEYRVLPADASTAAGQAQEWMEGVLEDMEHSFVDWLTEALTMLPFGWSLFEPVYKIRGGRKTKDPSRYSQFDDGRIGIRKLAARAQESLDKWEFNEHGECVGFFQRHPRNAQSAYIPAERFMLLRTKKVKDNPEGRSILRNAYVPYYYKKRLQNQEAIGFERDLTGIPLLSLPAEILNGTGDAAAATLAAYKKIVRDVKFNEHGGIIIPSDPYLDANGNPTDVQKVNFQLVSSPGNKSGNVDVVIKRYEAAIARVVLADFIMLGHNGTGSFALSKSKASLFLRSLEGYKDILVESFNKCVIERLWDLNGFEPEVMPYLSGGDVAPADLEEMGNFLARLTTSGMITPGDMDTENYLRSLAGLPEVEEQGLDGEAVDNSGSPSSDEGVADDMQE